MSKFIEIPASKRSISLRKPLYGVGINDADYIVQPVFKGKQVICPYYKTWKHVLNRCFSRKYHIKHPTYVNCTVEQEWLTFSLFKQWMERQDWEGKELDKDILIPGNKHYSTDNCIFVSRRLNGLLTDNGSRRGKYPQGVSFNSRANKFQAQCKVNGKAKYIGSFTTQEEASQTYKQFKSNQITEIANQQTDQRLKSGLLAHAEIIRGVML